MAGYAAINRYLGDCSRPVVAGMDNNSSSAMPPLTELRDDWYDQDAFFAAEPPHRLQDAYRVWLEEHPDELARVLRLRPDGPLEVTYDRGKKSFPTVERFDRIMVSSSVRVESVAHHYSDSLAAGSDHALVAADLIVPPPEG